MTAISLNSIQRKGAQIVGPMFGGLFVASFGVAGTYFIHASCFLVLIGCLALVRATNPPSTTPRERPLQAIAAGLRYVQSQPVIGTLIVMEASLSVFGSYSAMMVVFAREVFNAGPEGLGVLQSAAGFGSVVGSLALASAGDVRHKGRVLMVTGLTYAGAVLGFALSPGFALALPLLALAGGMDIVFGATRQTVIQLLTRGDMLGRVMSLSSVSMRGLGPSGGFVSGSLTTLLGSVQLATALGALTCAVVLCGAGLRVPLVRKFTGVGGAEEPHALAAAHPPVLSSDGGAAPVAPRA
jgi:hypothetical protein